MDRRREVTPEVVDALVASDMLRLLLPKASADRRSSCSTNAKANEALAWADASVPGHQPSNVSVGDLGPPPCPHDSALKVFGDPKVGCLGRAPRQTSKAIRVEGGYRLTGKWSFAAAGVIPAVAGRHSAVQNSRRHAAHAACKPDDRSFVFRRPTPDHRDWHVLGLRGTGSDSYAVEDLFVPDEHRRRAMRRRASEKGPIYTIGSTLLYATGFAA